MRNLPCKNILAESENFHFRIYISLTWEIYLVNTEPSIVSFSSLLGVKMLTFLVSTMSNPHFFFCWKMWVAFANFYIYYWKKEIFNDQSFNDTLTNDIVCFQQLDPDIYSMTIWAGKWEIPFMNTFWPYREKFTIWIHINRDVKRPHSRTLSIIDFGSRGPVFDPARGRNHLLTTTLYRTEPFIVTFSSTR